MLNPMMWLRSAAKAAVVNGVMDGLAEVVPADGETPADLAALRARLAAAVALPALPLAEADTEVEPTARRKARS